MLNLDDAGILLLSKTAGGLVDAPSCAMLCTRLIRARAAGGSASTPAIITNYSSLYSYFWPIIFAMVSVEDVRRTLVALGARLRAARLERNESMALFAERIGVSVPTLREMERGSPKVQVGSWLNAFWALDRLDEVDSLLAQRESLIERARRSRDRERRRVSRRSRPS